VDARQQQAVFQLFQEQPAECPLTPRFSVSNSASPNLPLPLLLCEVRD
jgi:hypothetical protein